MSDLVSPLRTSESHASSAWWHDVSVPLRSPLSESASADVCVVGLGGSGIAAVRAARALGASVIGVDAARIAGAAAGRNGGLLLGGVAEFHHDAVTRWGAHAATALYRLTLDEMRRMRDDSPQHTWWRGSLRIAEDEAEHADCVTQHDRMRADELPVEWYEGPEGRGLLFPEDGACNPVHRVLALAARVEGEGARLFEHSAVRDIAEGVVSFTNGARIAAPHIIVCTDGALGSLVPEASAQLRQVRLQMLATSPAHDVSIPRAVYARYGYDYWQQVPDGRVFMGGGRDQFVDAEYTDSDEPSHELQSWLEQRLRSAVRTSAPVTHRWAATVTYTHDSAPIARQFSGGVWGVGGYSGTGNVVGALCAAGAARRALGQPDAFLDVLDSLRLRTTP